MRTVKYSSHGQDEIVLDLLGEGGYFVDVGAANGKHGSNTYLLEQNHGWEGICIEPHPVHFGHLKQCRDAKCYQDIIFDDEQKHDFWFARVRPEFPTNHFNHACGGGSGIVKGHIAKNQKDMKPEHIESMQTVSLDSILKKAAAPKEIDFLDIDVEGAALGVLKSIDWDEYKFKLMCIECSDSLNNIIDFLNERWYVPFKTTGHDTFFKPVKSAEELNQQC